MFVVVFLPRPFVVEYFPLPAQSRRFHMNRFVYSEGPAAKVGKDANTENSRGPLADWNQYYGLRITNKYI